MSSDKSGRPRDPSVEAKIARATVDELTEVGFGGFSMESIARRAGIGKATIYRRYKNKSELLITVLRSAFGHANPEAPDTSEVREDLFILLSNTATMLTKTDIGQLFKATIPYLSEHTELATLASQLEVERRKLMLTVIDRGIRNGQIHVQDKDALIDSLLGAIYLRYLLLQKPIGAQYIRKLIRTILPEQR